MTKFRKTGDAPSWLPAKFEGEPYVVKFIPDIPALLIQYKGEDQVIPANWARRIEQHLFDD